MSPGLVVWLAGLVVWLAWWWLAWWWYRTRGWVGSCTMPYGMLRTLIYGAHWSCGSTGCYTAAHRRPVPLRHGSRTYIFGFRLGLVAWPGGTPRPPWKARISRYLGFLASLKAHMGSAARGSRTGSWCRTVETLRTNVSGNSIFRSTLGGYRSTWLGSLGGC